MATSLRASDRGSRFLRTGDEVDPESSLAKVPLFSVLSAEEREELVAVSSSHRVGRQQVVFCEGETLTHLYLVHTGSFKLVRHSHEGKELIVSLAQAGECFGALAHPIESRALAQSLEDSVLLVVPLTALRRTVARNPRLAIGLIEQALRRHETAETAATRLAFETVPERLAHLLLEVSDPDSGALSTPLNQTELDQSHREQPRDGVLHPQPIPLSGVTRYRARPAAHRRARDSRRGQIAAIPLKSCAASPIQRCGPSVDNQAPPYRRRPSRSPARECRRDHRAVRTGYSACSTY